MFRFLKKVLKRAGVLEPKINSFETSLVYWIDQTMRGDPEEGEEAFKELLESGVNPTDLNRELVIAYMYLLTRLSQKHYSNTSTYEKGMDEFHVQAYQWLLTDADINLESAGPFEELLRIRYADYDIAFSQKDNMSMHYFAKTFITVLNGSLRDEAMPLFKCATRFGSFMESSDESLGKMRQIYQEQRRSRRR